MPLVKVAVEYIRIHRGDSSDAEIARALKEQGFSDGTLTEAFRAAGERPARVAPERKPSGAEPEPRPSSGKRALVVFLASFSAASLIASALLFARNFRQARAAAAAERR
ncbi:MAG: hypothetical protein ACHQ2Z_15885 [Elusimicrobiota bacterium]